MYKIQSVYRALICCTDKGTKDGGKEKQTQF